MSEVVCLGVGGKTSTPEGVLEESANLPPLSWSSEENKPHEKSADEFSKTPPVWIAQDSLSEAIVPV